MKKLIIGFIAGAVLMLSLSMLTGSFTKEIELYIDGERQTMQQAFEALGADITVSDERLDIAKPTPVPMPTPKPAPTPEIIYKERLTDLETVVSNAKDSCVMIYVYLPDGTYVQGSGWAYKDYIVTAKHGVENAKKIEVFTDDSKSGARGTIEYIDDTVDIAVLRVPRTLSPLTLGDSDTLIEGEKLVGITSPEGVQNIIEECTFAGRSLNETQNDIYISDTIIAPGSSGGVILNYESEVIGMVYGKYEGFAAAIPINQIKPILEKLK